MKINVKTEEEIEIMRVGGRKLADIMNELEIKSQAGVNTWEIDQLADKLIVEFGGEPSFKGYGGEASDAFPATICASLNSEVVHGIPSKNTILKDGDVFKIDIGMKYKGMHTDMARSFAIGNADENARKIIDTVKAVFYGGIAVLKVGKKLNKYSRRAQKIAEKNGFSVVRNLVGHGIGKSLHEDPQITNYYDKKFCNFKLEAGMTFALEPMINAGGDETVLGEDGWVFKTKDNSLSAHWENTILITKKGVEILTET